MLPLILSPFSLPSHHLPSPATLPLFLIPHPTPLFPSFLRIPDSYLFLRVPPTFPSLSRPHLPHRSTSFPSHCPSLFPPFLPSISLPPPPPFTPPTTTANPALDSLLPLLFHSTLFSFSFPSLSSSSLLSLPLIPSPTPNSANWVDLVFSIHFG